MIRTLFVCLIALLCSPVRAQDVQSFIEKLGKYNAEQPQEKIYIHFNKPSYSAGETIFFKSYTTVGVNNSLSALSGVLYVELVSPADKIVERKVVATPMGIGVGSFDLADTVTEGRYRVRAYTNWMKNFAKDYFFEQPIDIFNGRSDEVFTQTDYQVRDKDVIYRVKLTGPDSQPLPKTRVSCVIWSQAKEVDKKTVTSDEQGIIEIAVPKKHKNSVITLRFKKPSGFYVNKIVRTVNPDLQYDTQLFPEGGRLLAGFLNNIAVKSINNKGLGVSSKVLLTRGADTLGIIETNKLGMGAAQIFINDTSGIQATAIYPDGSKQELSMPKIYASGYSVITNNTHKEKLFVEMHISEDRLDHQDLYFVVHHLGEVFFVSKTSANRSAIIFAVDRVKLPLGVVTVSILNSSFVPLIERPLFSFQELEESTVTLDKDAYKQREKVQVKFKIASGESNNLGAFSAAVYDLSKVNTDNLSQHNILSALLLNADIRGYIENPNYYFEDNKIKTADIDYLMLTQGWRNIAWEKLEVPGELQYKPEKSLSISGYTKRLGRSKPYSNARVQLISTRNFLDFLDTTSNEDGYFEFDNLIFPDSIKVLISAQDAKTAKKNIDIVYNEEVAAEVQEASGDLVAWDVNSSHSEELLAANAFMAELEKLGIKEKVIMIEEVVVRRSRPKVSENSSNLNGAGRADQVLTEEDLSTCPTLEMCLNGRLLGVYFENGEPYSTRSRAPMQVFLDGMPVDSGFFNTLNVADIESVEVLRSAMYTSIYGSMGANGVIIITSKTGKSALNVSSEPKGLITISPRGFAEAKQYYSPKYDVGEGIRYNSDQRSSIHWEPALVSNEKGEAEFSFFTSDSSGKYLLVIEGIDLHGNIFRNVTTINR